jgi:hypothetical protein
MRMLICLAVGHCQASVSHNHNLGHIERMTYYTSIHLDWSSFIWNPYKIGGGKEHGNRDEGVKTTADSLCNRSLYRFDQRIYIDLFWLQLMPNRPCLDRDVPGLLCFFSRSAEHYYFPKEQPYQNSLW